MSAYTSCWKKQIVAPQPLDSRLQVRIKIKTGKDIIIWCEEVWKSSNNLELRYLLRELVLFLRAYQAYGEALCGGHYTKLMLLLPVKGYS